MVPIRPAKPGLIALRRDFGPPPQDPQQRVRLILYSVVHRTRQVWNLASDVEVVEAQTGPQYRARWCNRQTLRCVPIKWRPFSECTLVTAQAFPRQLSTSKSAGILRVSVPSLLEQPLSAQPAPWRSEGYNAESVCWARCLGPH